MWRNLKRSVEPFLDQDLGRINKDMSNVFKTRDQSMTNSIVSMMSPMKRYSVNRELTKDILDEILPDQSAIVGASEEYNPKLDEQTHSKRVNFLK
jgi:hypothetical protein